MNEEQFQQSINFVRECTKNANVHDGLFTKETNDEEIRLYLEKNGLA